VRRFIAALSGEIHFAVFAKADRTSSDLRPLQAIEFAGPSRRQVTALRIKPFSISHK